MKFNKLPRVHRQTRTIANWHFWMYAAGGVSFVLIAPAHTSNGAGRSANVTPLTVNIRVARAGVETASMERYNRAQRGATPKVDLEPTLAVRSGFPLSRVISCTRALHSKNRDENTQGLNNLPHKRLSFYISQDSI